MAVRRRRRRRRRDGVHPRERARHAVHLVAGRLRRQLPVLLHRPPGLQPQSHHRPRSSPSSGCRAVLRRRLGLRDSERAITNVVMMGMGEPLQNYGSCAGAAHDARRPRLRPVAASRHGLDLRRGADDRPAGRGLSGGAGGIAARARTTSCATSWCRSTASTRSPNCWLPASATSTRAPRDFITFEYCMLDGVNDSAGASRAVALVRGHGGARVSVQGQPDSLQSVPALGSEAFAARARRRLRENAAGCWHRHHGAQDARRRH